MDQNEKIVYFVYRDLELVSIKSGDWLYKVQKEWYIEADEICHVEDLVGKTREHAMLVFNKVVKSFYLYGNNRPIYSEWSLAHIYEYQKIIFEALKDCSVIDEKYINS